MSDTTATVSSASSLPCHATIAVSDVYPHGYTVPDGFQVVGFRRALPGERFILVSNFANKAADCTTAGPKPSPYPRIIISELPNKAPKPPAPPTPESIYGTKTPKAPAGWYLGDFRFPKQGETFLTRSATAQTALFDFACDSYFILHRIPTLHDIYGTYTPVIPAGYESTGEIRLPWKEYFLCADFGPNGRPSQTLPPHAQFGFTQQLFSPKDTNRYRLILRKLPTPKRWVVEIEERPYAYTRSSGVGDTLISVVDGVILSVTEKNKYTEEAQGGAR